MFELSKKLVTAIFIFFVVFNAAPQIVPRAQAAGANVIQNPGFESTGAWTAIYSSQMGSVAKVQDSTYKHMGSYSGLTQTTSPRQEICDALLRQNLSVAVYNLGPFSYWIRKGSSAANGYGSGEVCIYMSGGYVLSYYHGFDGSSPPPDSVTWKYINAGNPATNIWVQISRNLYNDLFSKFGTSILTQNVTKIELCSYGWFDFYTYYKYGQRVNWDDIYMEKHVRAWTFMVYLDADWISQLYLESHLLPLKPPPGDTWNGDENATADINEMEMIGSTSEVAIIVQIDWYDRTKKVGRYFITQDNGTSAITSPKLETLSEVNMGNPSTLSSFVNWSISRFPAQRYALIFWDHGQGFRGTCVDSTSYEDWLTMPELKSALADAKAATGSTINLIGFMACVMQMAEVAYQIKDYANVIVGSQQVINAKIGWRFDYILDDLTSTPNMNETEFGRVIVDAYKYIAQGTTDPYRPTLSSVDLTRVNSLAVKIDNFSYCLITQMNLTRTQIQNCRTQAQEFYDGDNPTFIDLYNFTKATLSINNTSIQNAANALMYEINQTVRYEWHASGIDAHGVTIYFPENANAYERTTYEAIDMSMTYRWDDFLRAYHNIQ